MSSNSSPHSTEVIHIPERSVPSVPSSSSPESLPSVEEAAPFPSLYACFDDVFPTSHLESMVCDSVSTFRFSHIGKFFVSIVENVVDGDVLPPWSVAGVPTSLRIAKDSINGMRLVDSNPSGDVLHTEDECENFSVDLCFGDATLRLFLGTNDLSLVGFRGVLKMKGSITVMPRITISPRFSGYSTDGLYSFTSLRWPDVTDSILKCLRATPVSIHSQSLRRAIEVVRFVFIDTLIYHFIHQVVDSLSCYAEDESYSIRTTDFAPTVENWGNRDDPNPVPSFVTSDEGTIRVVEKSMIPVFLWSSYSRRKSQIVPDRHFVNVPQWAAKRFFEETPMSYNVDLQDAFDDFVASCRRNGPSWAKDLVICSKTLRFVVRRIIAQSIGIGSSLCLSEDLADPSITENASRPYPGYWNTIVSSVLGGMVGRRLWKRWCSEELQEEYSWTEHLSGAAGTIVGALAGTVLDRFLMSSPSDVVLFFQEKGGEEETDWSVEWVVKVDWADKTVKEGVEVSVGVEKIEGLSEGAAVRIRECLDGLRYGDEEAL